MNAFGRFFSGFACLKSGKMSVWVILFSFYALNLQASVPVPAEWVSEFIDFVSKCERDKVPSSDLDVQIMDWLDRALFDGHALTDDSKVFFKNLSKGLKAKKPRYNFNSKITVDTLNEMGCEQETDSPIHREFLKSAQIHSDLPVLDVGSAYGVNTIKALKEGSKVIATDIDPGHIVILVKQIKALNPYFLKNLSVHVGKFPNDLDLEPNSVKAVLMSLIAHYLTPAQVVEGFKRIQSWLKPNGRLMFLAASPYFYESGEIPDFFHEALMKRIESFESRAGQTVESVLERFPAYLPEIVEARFSELIAEENSFLSSMMKRSLSGLREVLAAIKVNHFHLLGGTDEALKDLGFSINEVNYYSRWYVRAPTGQLQETERMGVKEKGAYLGIVASKSNIDESESKSQDQPEANLGFSCDYCHKRATSKCSRCKEAHYCSAECQKACWPVHKKSCRAKN